MFRRPVQVTGNNDVDPRTQGKTLPDLPYTRHVFKPLPSLPILDINNGYADPRSRKGKTLPDLPYTRHISKPLPTLPILDIDNGAEPQSQG